MAIGAVGSELTGDPGSIERVIFCTYSAKATAAYEAVLGTTSIR